MVLSIFSELGVIALTSIMENLSQIPQKVALNDSNVSLFGAKGNQAHHKKYDEKYQIISWGHWFALFNVIFCLIIASRYLFIMDWPNTLGGRVYAFISLIGHFSFLVFMTYLIFIFPLSFILKKAKTLRIIAVSIATIGLTLMLVDQQVFYSVNLHFNVLVWSLLIEPSYNISTHEWQSFFAFMPFIFLIQLLFANWSWLKLRSLQRQNWVRWLSLLFIFCFMATHLVFAWADAFFYRPVTMQKANYPFSYPMTARNFLEQYGVLDHSDYEARLSKEGDPSSRAVNYPLTPLSLSPYPSNYNIVIILFDELDHEDILNSNTLSQFADQNLYFTRHYTDKNPEFTLEYGISPIFEASIKLQSLPSLFDKSLDQRNYHVSRYAYLANSQKDSVDGALHEYFIQKSMKALDSSIQSQLSIWEQDNKTQPWFLAISLSHQVLKNNKADFQALIDRIVQAQGNTLIVMTAKSNKGESHSLAPDNVPLMIKWPQLSVDVPLDKLTTNQDVLRTIMQRVMRVNNLPNDYSQGEDLFYPTRSNQWWIDGQFNNIIIQTQEASIVLNRTGTAILDRRLANNYVELKLNDTLVPSNKNLDSNIEQFKKQQLGFVIQALFDMQRFWAS